MWWDGHLNNLTHYFSMKWGVIILICMEVMLFWGMRTDNGSALLSQQDTILEQDEMPKSVRFSGQLPISKDKEYYIIYANVTAYNTTVGQCDSSPCIAASGENICGKEDAVACPRSIPFGTWISIDNRFYRCTDRTNIRFSDRFDINYNLDIQGAKQWGIRYLPVKIYGR